MLQLVLPETNKRVNVDNVYICSESMYVQELNTVLNMSKNRTQYY